MNQMQKFSEDLLHFTSFFSIGSQDVPHIQRHLAGLAPLLDALSAVCSVCQVFWLIQSCEKQHHSLMESEGKGGPSSAPGKESWANIGQSHRKHFPPVKSLLKTRVVKASFIFEAVHIKDSLAWIAEGVKHTKPTFQGCKWSALRAQASVASCFAQIFLVETRVFHLMSATISSLGLTFRFFFSMWCFEIFAFDVGKILLSINVKSRLKKIKWQKDEISAFWLEQHFHDNWMKWPWKMWISLSVLKVQASGICLYPWALHRPPRICNSLQLVCSYRAKAQGRAQSLGGG